MTLNRLLEKYPNSPELVHALNLMRYENASEREVLFVLLESLLSTNQALQAELLRLLTFSNMPAVVLTEEQLREVVA